MGISEFALHNVLRTYARQDRLGQAQKVKAAASKAPAPADQVSLSAAGRKAQWMGQFAAEVVDLHHPTLDDDERASQVRTTKQELIERHRAEVEDDSVSPEDLEAQIRPLYAG